MTCMSLCPLQVKAQFGNDPYVYNGFLKVMKQFKAQEIETKVVLMHSCLSAGLLIPQFGPWPVIDLLQIFIHTSSETM
jgi:hypothetical protein